MNQFDAITSLTFALPVKTSKAGALSAVIVRAKEQLKKLRLPMVARPGTGVTTDLFASDGMLIALFTRTLEAYYKTFCLTLLMALATLGLARTILT